MENIISRTEYQNACDTVDCVSGTMSVSRCTEANASRHFPSDPYLEYLNWLDEYRRDELAYQELLAPHVVFERYVNEVFSLLEPDGSLYIPDYRAFLKDMVQIRNAINWHLGMAWISDHHIREAIKRKRYLNHP